VSPSIALAAALGSAVCYGVASVLEQVGARRTDTVTSIDPRFILRLGRELPYVTGLVLDGVGWVLSLVALQTLPLFLVQSAVASSIAVTALVAWVVLGTRLTRRELAAVAAIIVGLVLLSVAAAPDSARPVGAAFGWALVAGVFVLVAVGTVLARADAARGALELAAVAGLAFSGTAICGRVLQVPAHPLDLVRDPVAWALVGYGLLGLLLFAIALQRGPVTTTNAVLFAVETVVPAVVGVALLGDRARAGRWPLMAVGAVTAISGSVMLALWNEPEPAAADTGPVAGQRPKG
jgi:drug/metabolite transporter (DMT)-like permease